MPAADKSKPAPEKVPEQPAIAPPGCLRLQQRKSPGEPRVSPAAWTRERVLQVINTQPPHDASAIAGDRQYQGPESLAKIAIEDGDMNNRLIAVHTMTDQKLLAKVAGEARDEW